MLSFARTVSTSLLVAAVLVGCSSSSTHSTGTTTGASPEAPTVTQYTFESPEEAVVALVDAAATLNGDELRLIFGPNASALASGDSTRDDINLQRFAAAYDVRHVLIETGPGQRILAVGESQWELPVPIVERDGRWIFDTAAGADEIRARRIGRNELEAIGICAALDRVQWAYFSMDPNGDGVREFARNVRSTPGTRDGLYWPDSEAPPFSPVGEAVARAQLAGDIDASISGRQPYHGYYYKVLTRSGPAAPGGARSFIDADGNMTGGFAFLAWPETYGDTGVMSFMVSDNGLIYQADFGANTMAIAEAMTEFNPSSSWGAAQK
ncbi:MAG: DUF2950 family protein [Phycisphaerae bacterium]|nr:DUF2950 family protein [Phycisphaerae bacterium]